MLNNFFNNILKHKNSVTQSSGMNKPIVHVEVCQVVDSTYDESKLFKIVEREILLKEKKIFFNKTYSTKSFRLEETQKHVKSLYFYTDDDKINFGKEDLHRYDFNFYYYRLNEEDGVSETMQKDGEDISASTHWLLPSQEFNELWENLYYGDNIKGQLLNYIETTMEYSRKQVNAQIISWNKIILLHGPPGTGKTSLCKALAQKVMIRLSKQYNRGQLVEINSHSLFSKWFSESGKLVMNLFNDIRELLQDSSTLVFILIDEVESLAHARKACSNGTEPSDSIRVVNALLTQLDNLKRHPNVLIMTTSNLTEAIDIAFIDRADIKQLIPLPGVQAIYNIYFSCIKELMRTRFIESEPMLYPYYVNIISSDDCRSNYPSSFELYIIAIESKGLSGRTLRKIPFLTHALFKNATQCYTLMDFLKSMKSTVSKERSIRMES